MKDIKELLAKTKNKTLMVIYPHPDDETMFSGGLLMAAKSSGWKTIVVTLTKGGAGQIHVKPNGQTLKNIREKELRQALKIMNVDHLELGDYDDGKLKRQSWSSWLKKLLEKFQPSIVVTYDPSGITGHPDHIALSLAVKKLVSKDMLLLWSTVSSEFAPRIVNPKTLQFNCCPDYELDLGLNWTKKWQAARAHASQALGKGFPIPLSLVLAWQHYEWYHKVDLTKSYPYKFVEFKI